MIHIWMVHKRLLSVEPNGKKIQEALFDYLWEDTTNRIRNQNVNELSVNKYLKDVQSLSFKTCIELDQSLKMPTEDEIVTDIGGAVWRSVYDKAEDVQDDHIMEFAKYRFVASDLNVNVIENCKLMVILFVCAEYHVFNQVYSARTVVTVECSYGQHSSGLL